MRIVFLSHTPLGGPFVVGSHHLSKAMANMGHDVVHLTPPVTPGHIFLCNEKFQRARIARWWRKGECLLGVRDIVPGSLLPWSIVRRLTDKPHRLFAFLMQRSVVRRLHAQQSLRPDVVFIDEPRLAGLLDLFTEARVVYRATDLYAHIRRDDSVLSAERYVIKRSSRFIAMSQPVADHLKLLGADNVLVMENGVDLEHFSPCHHYATRVEKENGERVAVYVGAMDQRFGFDCIVAAATENPDVTFWLLGPITKEGVQRLHHLGNVKMHGAIAFSDLPGYLRKASIALLPLSDDPSNAGRSPMKLFEYAAVGLPVIATATPELSRRGLRFVVLTRTPSDFALKVKEWFSGKLELEDGTSEASKHSWSAKGTQALDFALN